MAKKMEESTLGAILDTKINNALGYGGGKLSTARTTALEYYNGEPFGNEQDGRSQVVSRDVAEAIDSVMPALMKIFASGEEVVRFGPRKPGDEAASEQATDYVNWIWHQQNEGYKILFDWFKDGLLNRVAVVKVYWDESTKTTREQYEGLTDHEYDLLLTHPDSPSDDVEIIDEIAYPDPTAPPLAAAPPLAPPGAAPGGPSPLAGPPALPMPGMPPQGVPPLAVEPPPPQTPMLHDCTIRRTATEGRVVIVPMPGEEFLIDRRAVSLDETPFCAHRFKRTISQLLEEGYPESKIKDLADGESTDFNQERIERFNQEDDQPHRVGDEYDPSMREIWVTECYLRVDYDGDGIAELRKVTMAGGGTSGAVLDNEEVDDHPFAALTPIPMPHKFHGISIADQTMDVQLIKSTLMRTTLDHYYNALMPQIGVVADAAELDDLLTRRPGGIVRLKRPDALVPLPNPPLGSDPFQMITYMDQVRAQRTGVQPMTAGPGSDVLNNAFTQTATGVNVAENASQERVEIIARNYAEMGVKQAFKKVLRLVTTHQQKPKVIRLRGQWVEMDPREWTTDFDLTVSVGIGTGNRSQQLSMMMNLLSLDQQIVTLQGGVQGPLVNAGNIYEKLKKVIQFGGLKSVEPYYTDPTRGDPIQGPQKPPDPTIAKTQMELQADAQKTRFQAQQEQQKVTAQMQLEREKSAADINLRRELGLTELSLQARRLGLDEQVAALDAEIKRLQLSSDAGLRHRQVTVQERGQSMAEQASAAEDEMKKRTVPGYKAPKLAALNLVKHPDGSTHSAEIHFDDGTMQPVPINRMIPGAPVQ